MNMWINGTIIITYNIYKNWSKILKQWEKIIATDPHKESQDTVKINTQGEKLIKNKP